MPSQNDLNNLILGAALVERLIGMALNIGQRVRDKIAAGEPVTEADLDTAEAEALAAVEEGRQKIRDRQAAGGGSPGPG